MASGEIPISRINAGDSVFYDGKIQVVRGRLRVSHPSRTILFTEEGRSISLTDGALIERVGEGIATTRYAGPSWICGMPEQTEVASLEPGDLILDPDAEVIAWRLKTSNGYVLVTFDVVEPHSSHIRIHEHRERIRLIAKGLGVQSLIEPPAGDKNAIEMRAGELTLPCEVIFESGLKSVVSITSDGDMVTLTMHEGSKKELQRTDVVICLQPVPISEPTSIHEAASLSAFRCISGHLTKPELPLETGERFIECEICGLPATAELSPSPSTSSSGPPDSAKYCGTCGKVRKPENAFCTGCGNRFSKIDTTGFRS